MDIEFHYYITYLIAARAGLPPPEAVTLAWASQYTDDNTFMCTVDAGRPTEYRNYISQTADILKPRLDLMRIYSLFHFLPGDPQAPGAWRKDGAMHWLTTTPGSDNANDLLAAALATGNLYRIGIAAHAFADTWAHQNFVGYANPFNAFLKEDVATAIMPNVGHADAFFAPDEVDRRWEDPRLIHGPIDNRARFLAAADDLYRKLARHWDPALPPEELSRRAASLRDDLGRCFATSSPDPTAALAASAPDPPAATPATSFDVLRPGVLDPAEVARRAQEERLSRYRALAAQVTYGGRDIPPYDPDRWMDEALHEQVHGLRDRSDFILSCLDLWPDVFTWRDRAGDAYRQTPWYQFQEAVKAHQRETWQLLANRNFLALELPAF